MGFDRPALGPIFHDQINLAPEWKIWLGGAGDVFEEPHPKCGQRFMIKISDAVMRGERTNLLAHSLERLVWRQRIEITQCNRDVGRVSEFGCRYARVFE